MKISGWGQQDWNEADILVPRTVRECKSQLSGGFQGVPRGLGRSYGDASIADQVIDTQYLNHILAFDRNTGIVTCQAGVSLNNLLAVIISAGWFLPVTPGTRFISLGGAVASDVHGKNHHLDGTFCSHVLSLEMITGNGLICCSPAQNPELFHATCGGMGLTGLITTITLQLRPIVSTQIIERRLSFVNLEHGLALMTEHQTSTYSVAWIDTVNRNRDGTVGRGLLYLGEHSSHPDGLSPEPTRMLNVPPGMPGLINRFSVSLFNRLYRMAQQSGPDSREVHLFKFFYPLDGLGHWNRLYGKRGLSQYQFVLPDTEGSIPLISIVRQIISSGLASPLVVLKKMGPENENLMSFPMSGYTLAVDFVWDQRAKKLMKKLDAVVHDAGGRLYLSKDNRMSVDVLRQGYPRLDEFLKIREQYQCAQFRSSLSSRLGLDGHPDTPEWIS